MVCIVAAMATTRSAKKSQTKKKVRKAAANNGAAKSKPAAKAKKAGKSATKTKAKKTAKADKTKAKKATKADKTKAKKADKTKKGGGKSKAKKGRKSMKKLLKAAADPLLFTSFSEGERADALRILTSDRRLANMTKVGRYRVIAVEPLVLKPPNPLAGRRLASVVAYDYSSDKSVHACVDIAGGTVTHLRLSNIQPMLSHEEEAAAVAIAMASPTVASKLSLGDEPQAAMHYWSNRESELAFRRRSAVVMFGQPGARPSLIAVVDLLDSEVADVVPAEQW